MSEPDENFGTYRISVEFPMRVGPELIDAMFVAVSDAAFDCEPAKRVDLFVYGGQVDEPEGPHRWHDEIAISPRTYEVADGWVVADAGGWLPGVYDTEEAARNAARFRGSA